jgi:hypothetical protein
VPGDAPPDQARRQREDFSLCIGGSRLPEVTPALRAALVFPSANPLLKEEPKTCIWRLALPSGESAIVKLYRRRGVLNLLRGDSGNRFSPFRRCRVEHEFSALSLLADAAIPCSLPLLWGWGQAAEHGRFELIVTREILNATNLKEHFAQAGQALSTVDLRPLSRMLRRMHERGVYHGALSPKNILVVEQAGSVRSFYLIDMARAVCFPGDITGSRMAWFDLLSLMRRLRQSCRGLDCHVLLQEYGLPADAIEKFLHELQRFRPTRHTRNWLAFRFRLKAMFSRRRRSIPPHD